MTRLGRPLPALVFALMLIAALFALQCPVLGCSSCGADEVAARQGGGSLLFPAAIVVAGAAVAPLLSGSAPVALGAPVSLAAHPSLVARLLI